MTIPRCSAAEAQSSLRATLVVRALLSRLREVCDGPCSCSRGRRLRPSTRCRGSVRTPTSTCSSRRCATGAASALPGFQAVGPPMDWESLHHVQRLVDPELGASVEVHRRPKWVTWATAPTFDDLLAAAVPSATGVEGVLAPSPVTTRSSSRRTPGRSGRRELGDLVDVAAMRREEQADADELAAAGAASGASGGRRST